MDKSVKLLYTANNGDFFVVGSNKRFFSLCPRIENGDGGLDVKELKSVDQPLRFISDPIFYKDSDIEEYNDKMLALIIKSSVLNYIKYSEKL